MMWQEVKEGDVLMPVEGEGNLWRAPQLVLGVRPGPLHQPWAKQAFILVTIFSLADASVTDMSFYPDEPVNAFYDILREGG